MRQRLRTSAGALVVKCKTLNKKLWARLRQADKASSHAFLYFIFHFRLVFLSGCLVCCPLCLSVSLFLAVPPLSLACVEPRLKDSCVKGRASHLNKQFDTLGLADFRRGTRSEKHILEPNPRTRPYVNQVNLSCSVASKKSIDQRNSQTLQPSASFHQC